MAEKHSKRQRDETLLETETEDRKRHKSYNQILSILEQEEEEDEEPSSQDLLSADIFTTFQHELSSSVPLIISPNPDPEPDLHNNNTLSISTSSVLKEEDDEKQRVIRHLLEASDDELGIPNNKVECLDDDEVINGGDFSLGDGFWEFEDQAANYYTLLQSQLFM